METAGSWPGCDSVTSEAPQCPLSLTLTLTVLLKRGRSIALLPWMYDSAFTGCSVLLEWDAGRSVFILVVINLICREKPELRQQEEAGSLFSVGRFTIVRVPPYDTEWGNMSGSFLWTSRCHMTWEVTACNCLSPSPSNRPELGAHKTHQHCSIITYANCHSSISWQNTSKYLTNKKKKDGFV